MSLPTVAVLATLDSKAEVARFTCESLKSAGVDTWLMDISLRAHTKQADHADDALARHMQMSRHELGLMSRPDATQKMIVAASLGLNERLAENALHGVLGIGGANGCTIACGAMRRLPLGLPKLMLSPVAGTAAVQWYVGPSDIMMFTTVGDISLNRITRTCIANAAGAIAQMARNQRQRTNVQEPAEHPPLVALSSFGNLQPAVDSITEQLEAACYEVIQCHASGPGGRALEALARGGELAGVIDLTTSEITDQLTGGVYNAGDDRLIGAGAAGLPQVVVPGCLDFTNWWVGSVPERYRQREFYRYNSEILLMRTNAEEFCKLAIVFAERLNAAKWPVRVLIPLRGFSQLTTRKTSNLMGDEVGDWAQPETDSVFGTTLKQHFHNGAVQEVDAHINDPQFADACVRTFFECGGGKLSARKGASEPAVAWPERAPWP